MTSGQESRAITVSRFHLILDAIPGIHLLWEYQLTPTNFKLYNIMKWVSIALIQTYVTKTYIHMFTSDNRTSFNHWQNMHNNETNFLCNHKTTVFSAYCQGLWHDTWSIDHMKEGMPTVWSRLGSWQSGEALEITRWSCSPTMSWADLRTLWLKTVNSYTKKWN